MERMKPQDILILLKVFLWSDRSWTQAVLAESLGMSASEVNHGLKRLAAAKLYDPIDKSVMCFALCDLLHYGIKHFFPAKLGAIARGIPTSHAGPILKNELVFNSDDIYVWPDPAGTVRGQQLEPLYPSVPAAARSDQSLYELLSLIDALRVGRAREVALAREALRERLVGTRAA